MVYTLLSRKHYAEFQVKTPFGEQLQQKIRHTYYVNNLCLASSGGVLYVFRQDKVSIYSATSLDFSSIRSRISLATGAHCPPGKTTTTVFEAAMRVTSATSETNSSSSSRAKSATSQTNSPSLDLDLLHYRLSESPPVGTEMNIFDPSFHPDLVVKVCPFQDGFTVAFHFQSSGKCFVVCDAKSCATGHREEVFRSRAAEVMKSLAHALCWE